MREIPCEIDINVNEYEDQSACCISFYGDYFREVAVGEHSWMIGGYAPTSHEDRTGRPFGYRTDESGLFIGPPLHETLLPLEVPVDIVALDMLYQLAIHESKNLQLSDGEIVHRFPDDLTEHVASEDEDDWFGSMRARTDDERERIIRAWEQSVRFVFLMAQGGIPALKPKLFSGLTTDARHAANEVAFPLLAEACPGLVREAIGSEAWVEWVAWQYSEMRRDLDNTRFIQGEL
jgi:hypothetical protein